MEKLIKGVLIDYDVVTKKNKQNEEYEAHVFTFKIPSGVTDVEMMSEKYIENFLNNVGYEELEDYADDLMVNKTEVDLYLVNNENFIGYSLSEPFKENNFPHTMGMAVEITEVIYTPNGITLTLADGTIGKRSFAKEIKSKTGEDSEWYPDVQKQMRYIKNELGEDPDTFDFDSLVGRKVNYIVKKGFGGTGKPYLEIAELLPAEPKKTSNDNADALNDLLGD